MRVPTHAYGRYLAAKEAIDDQSINPRVWDQFMTLLEAREAASGQPLRVLELGAGIGAMARRVLRGLPLCDLDYVLLDVDAASLSYAQARLGSLLEAEFDGVVTIRKDGLSAHGQDARVNLTLVHDEALSFCTRSTERFDAVIGQALMDLLEIGKALDAFLSVLLPGGCAYFPISFDGLTHFGPWTGAAFDRRVEAFYDASMNQRALAEGRPEAGTTGRQVLAELADRRLAGLWAGSSDWVVFGGPDGYTEDEKQFLTQMLAFVEGEHTKNPLLDERAFHAWLKQKHRDIAEERFILIAHQIDVLAQME